MKRVLFVLAVMLLPTMLMAQAKRPTLMVIPADSWCAANGFMKTEDASRCLTMRRHGKVIRICSVLWLK